MELFEKVNQILKERKLSKRTFAKQLINLGFTLKSTGEVPSEQTIYNYLNGNREIKLEVLSYMCEALDLPEQFFFNNTKQTKQRLIEYLFQDPSKQDILYFKRFMNMHENKLNKSDSDEIAKTAELLHYAPKSVILKVQDKLQGYKKIHDDMDKDF